MNNVRVLLKQENFEDCQAQKLLTVQLHLQSSEFLSWDLICQNNWKQNFILYKEFSPLMCKVGNVTQSQCCLEVEKD